MIGYEFGSNILLRKVAEEQGIVLLLLRRFTPVKEIQLFRLRRNRTTLLFPGFRLLGVVARAIRIVVDGGLGNGTVEFEEGGSVIRRLFLC